MQQRWMCICVCVCNSARATLRSVGVCWCGVKILHALFPGLCQQDRTPLVQAGALHFVYIDLRQNCVPYIYIYRVTMRCVVRANAWVMGWVSWCSAWRSLCWGESAPIICCGTLILMFLAITLLIAILRDWVLELENIAKPVRVWCVWCTSSEWLMKLYSKFKKGCAKLYIEFKPYVSIGWIKHYVAPTCCITLWCFEGNTTYLIQQTKTYVYKYGFWGATGKHIYIVIVYG